MGVLANMRRRPMRQLGTVALPLDTTGGYGGNVVAGAPQILPIPVTPHWQQLGKYAVPMATQMAANYPGMQLRCGVEGISRRWGVAGDGDVPYWLQNQQQQNPRVVQRTGMRPGEPIGPTQAAQWFGQARQDRAQQIQGLAQGALGW